MSSTGLGFETISGVRAGVDGVPSPKSSSHAYQNCMALNSMQPMRPSVYTMLGREGQALWGALRAALSGSAREVQQLYRRTRAQEEPPFGESVYHAQRMLLRIPLSTKTPPKRAGRRSFPRAVSAERCKVKYPTGAKGLDMRGDLRQRAVGTH